MPRSFHSARFIPSEEIDASMVRQWQFGNMHDAPALAGKAPIAELPVLGDLLPPPAPRIETPVEVLEPAVEDSAPRIDEAQVQAMIAQARQEAHDAAYQQGLEAGLAQGVAEGQQQADAHWQQKWQDYEAQQGLPTAQRLEQLVQQAQQQLSGLDQRLAPDVLQLACDIARQVVRQELRCNPQALLPVVREALDMLGAESKPATVRLNPQDWEVLKTHLQAAFPQPKIEWLQDAAVQPGDCVVESAGSRVDGSLERRWQRAVAALGLVSTWYDGAPSYVQQ